MSDFIDKVWKAKQDIVDVSYALQKMSRNYPDTELCELMEKWAILLIVSQDKIREAIFEDSSKQLELVNKAIGKLL